MIKQKHQPQRTCIGCREAKNKRDLIRVVRTPEGPVTVDPTGKANGRGVYVCRKVECLERALTKERLAQALKVTVPQERIAELRAALQNELSKV